MFSYLTDTLTIVGLLLLLGLLLIRYLLKTKKLKQLPANLDEKVPPMVWEHGYLLGVLITGLGLFLTHNEIHRSEQQRALSQLLVEYDQNLSAIMEMSHNIRQLQNAHRSVSDALRSGDSKILNIMFPDDKRPEDTEFNVSQVVDTAFSQLKSERLFNSKPDMDAFVADKSRIKPKVNKQHATHAAVQDINGKTYVIREEVWYNFKNVYTQLPGFSAPDYEDTKLVMNDLRSQYDLVTNHAGDYIKEAKDFVERNTFIGNGDVYEILNKEKLSFQSLYHYGIDINKKLKALNQTKSDINQLLRELSS